MIETWIPRAIAGRRLAELAAVTTREIVRYLAARPFVPAAEVRSFTARRSAEWAAALGRVVGLDVRLQGERPSRASLVISNHRSYTDILVLNSVLPCVFVAKAEVARWPVLGTAADLAGTVYVDRKDANSRAASLRTIARRLESGISVITFPEGTTSAGPGIRAFRPGTFRLAANRGVRVVPVALYYPDAADNWEGEPFGAHFFRRFGRPGAARVEAWVAFGPPLVDGDAAALKAQAEGWIRDRLQEWESGRRGRPG